MARTTVELPASFLFITEIPIRVTDLNYGGHVGNDSFLSLIHEARMQFLRHFGHSEKSFGSTALIMSDVTIVFKHELFYGDVVRIHVAVNNVSKVSFDIVYKLEKEAEGKTVLVASAKTGMVCYNYELRRVVAVPSDVQIFQLSSA